MSSGDNLIGVVEVPELVAQQKEEKWAGAPRLAGRQASH